MMSLHLTTEVYIMSIFNSMYNAVGGIASGVKDTIVQTASSFKKSTEDFVGDFVIKSTINRLKEGTVNFLDAKQKAKSSSGTPILSEEGSEDVDRNAPSSKKKNRAAFGSTGFVQSILQGVGLNSDDNIDLIAEQVNGALENVGKDISEAVTTAVREKVQSIEPDDVMKGFGSMLGDALKGDPDAEQTNSSFKIDSLVQIIGAIIAVIGMMMFAANSYRPSPEKTKAEPRTQKEEHATEEQATEEMELSSSMSIH